MTPRLAVALVAAVLTVATSATPAVADPPPLATCDHPPAVVAHRGGNELYVENTLLAFDTSYTEAGAQVWETDVRFDRNNIPVILHDATVDRTSPATGEIAKLAATGSGGRIATDDGQVIPTEWELLDLARQRGARVLLELKVTPANSVQWGNFFNRVDVTVGAAGVAVTSFDAALLAEVHRRRPDLSLGFLDGRGYRSAADIEATGADLYMKEAPSVHPGPVRRVARGRAGADGVDGGRPGAVAVADRLPGRRDDHRQAAGLRHLAEVALPAARQRRRTAVTDTDLEAFAGDPVDDSWAETAERPGLVEEPEPEDAD
jgi:glycerophosphoryl diester phosphodiesterase